jgi:hypothetical protein
MARFFISHNRRRTNRYGARLPGIVTGNPRGCRPLIPQNHLFVCWGATGWKRPYEF